MLLISTILMHHYENGILSPLSLVNFVEGAFSKCNAFSKSQMYRMFDFDLCLYLWNNNSLQINSCNTLTSVLQLYLVSLSRYPPLVPSCYPGSHWHTIYNCRTLAHSRILCAWKLNGRHYLDFFSLYSWDILMLNEILNFLLLSSILFCGNVSWFTSSSVNGWRVIFMLEL